MLTTQGLENCVHTAHACPLWSSVLRGERLAGREYWTLMMNANHCRHCSGRTIMENTEKEYRKTSEKLDMVK